MGISVAEISSNEGKGFFEANLCLFLTVFVVFFGSNRPRSRLLSKGRVALCNLFFEYLPGSVCGNSRIF